MAAGRYRTAFISGPRAFSSLTAISSSLFLARARLLRGQHIQHYLEVFLGLLDVS